MPESVRGTALGRLYGDDARELAWVGICDTPRTRARGLLGVSEMATDECILLVPCRSIHTYGMRMNIDVACLDGEFRIVAIREDLAPRKLLLTRRFFSTRAVLEAAAGAFRQWGVRVGDRLTLERDPGDAGGSSAGSPADAAR